MYSAIVEGQEEQVHLMNTSPDKRIKPRFDCDYPAIVKGYDAIGNNYDETAELVNLSACGLYMRANRNIEKDSKVSITILLTCASIDADTPKIGINGIVMRSDPQEDDTYGIAVQFLSYHFQ